MKKYSIGIDFGTLSARAVIADTSSGEPLSYESVFYYPHGVIDELCGKALPAGYALQHPKDYTDALEFLLSDVVKNNDVSAEDIVGIGIDFTACTVLPVTKELEPMCMLERFSGDPHAYAKLWKHHGAKKYVPEIERAAIESGEDILLLSGGVMTSEFMIPKIYETFRESRELYDQTHLFMNAGDYIASLLVGKRPIHSAAYASIKEHYDGERGAYPSKRFFSLLHRDLENVVEQKLNPSISPVGSSVGTLCPEWAQRCGLHTGIHIAAPVIDAQAPFGVSRVEDGSMLLIMGTSGVIAMLSSSPKRVSGVISQGLGSVAPGLMTLESGLAAMGDLYEWFVRSCVPSSYEREAESLGMNIHKYLRSLASKKRIGESRLIALDWWNGSRSVVCNDRLSGMLVGMDLSTRPEDIYRALLEASAFALRRICDNYREQGIAVESLVATGGIALKDELLMQICADVLDLRIDVMRSLQATAFGAASFGAVAAGVYDSISSAARSMRRPIERSYEPIRENVEAYEKIYAEYVRLYNYFGKESSVMENIHNLGSENI